MRWGGEARIQLVCFTCRTEDGSPWTRRHSCEDCAADSISGHRKQFPTHEVRVYGPPVEADRLVGQLAGKRRGW